MTTPDITDIKPRRRGPTPKAPRKGLTPGGNLDKAAGNLCVQDIGDTVSFNWTFRGSRVHAHVAGELRQIEHRVDATTVNLTGCEGNGVLTEFVLEHNTRVEVKTS